jgi:hypothetical protein
VLVLREELERELGQKAVQIGRHDGTHVAAAQVIAALDALKGPIRAPGMEPNPAEAFFGSGEFEIAIDKQGRAGAGVLVDRQDEIARRSAAGFRFVIRGTKRELNPVGPLLR